MNCLYMHALFVNFIYLCINIALISGTPGHYALLIFILFACLLTIFTQTMHNNTLHEESSIFVYNVLIPCPTGL